MKRRLQSLLAAGLLTISVQATAECTHFYCEQALVQTLYTTKNGNVFVQVSGTTSNLNCSLAEGVYLTLEPSAPRFREMYASILAHQLADKPMMFRVDIGSTGCTIAYIAS